MPNNPTNTTVLSVVVPMHNEADNINEFYTRAKDVLTQLDEPWEIICVNDGSRDDTLAQLSALHQLDPRVKIINFSRNFGKEIALTAGIDHACGQAVIPIDADLQDPPELIVDLVNKWREGYDVVNATRRTRQGESWLKQATAGAFYKVLEKTADIPIPRNTGDFRLLSRPAVEALKRIPERTRFMKGLFAWVGFKQATVLYDRHPRHAGQTKWNYWRLWNFAIDGIVSFSSTPLKIWGYFGLLIASLSFLYASLLIIRTWVYGIDLPGYASLMVVVLFLGGIQLITLGILGEYLGRIYDETKQRPLYIVRDYFGINSEADK
jgi:glycosyltransferase involved in cell wall biosynthesis